MRWSFLPLIAAALAGWATALSSTGTRLLVVLEEESKQSQYSSLWAQLKSRGYDLSFESPKSDKLSLFRLGERAYDHVILLPPAGKAYGPALSPKILLDFINSEGNILLGLTADHPTPAAISSLLLELDIHISPDRQAVVVDHFNYDSSSASEKHDVLVVPTPKSLRTDLKNFFAGKLPIAFPRAVGQTLGNDSPLLAPILRASPNAYVYNPKEETETVEDLYASGEQIALVSALQARNSARLTVLGSVEALEDKWFDAVVEVNGRTSKTQNSEFAKQLTAWTFKEVGVLKVGRVQHHLKSGSDGVLNESLYPAGDLNPKIYRVKNDVTFTIELSEYSNDRLIPFTPDANDVVQLEFSMLSPFHRLRLEPSGTTANSTFFSTSFTLPDQHGIFNFRVNYKRPFLSNVDEKREVTVRHFAHDEWPRSWNISGAWTWIAGIWVTVAGWLAFVAVWLWSAPAKQTGIKKTQ
ncbi:dolichyl-diphosphooligosaccharide-protein glycosyltransferase subunit [Microthyrium microscopicum]|uniref:Dolichyl-diphosphooligosaccharide--protein glycosyltransferase subunit WBP1 n=1 Tax=Microthyrium microscopicum TaxID=703497 RepID=A0A6A6ULB8_9PEZI|nr:dolichyl-diphosphooligosaccharide-protein glycosyltransferase subunit [Microthyrium microscopicum]